METVCDVLRNVIVIESESVIGVIVMSDGIGNVSVSAIEIVFVVSMTWLGTSCLKTVICCGEASDRYDVCDRQLGGICPNNFSQGEVKTCVSYTAFCRS